MGAGGGGASRIFFIVEPRHLAKNEYQTHEQPSKAESII